MNRMDPRFVSRWKLEGQLDSDGKAVKESGTLRDSVAEVEYVIKNRKVYNDQKRKMSETIINTIIDQHDKRFGYMPAQKVQNQKLILLT
jgi:hypothetical protein